MSEIIEIYKDGVSLRKSVLGGMEIKVRGSDHPPIKEKKIFLTEDQVKILKEMLADKDFNNSKT